jgi:molybdate transport system substrate-binding protein
MRLVSRIGFAVLLAAALAVGGCGGANGAAEAEARAATLTLYEPCVLGGPVLRLIAAYQERHPEADIAPQTYKPNELPAQPTGPALVVTAGDVEMAVLVKQGMVSQPDVRTFATNTYPLAVIAAAKGAPRLKQINGLAGPSVKRILIDDPSRSSLGAAAKQALTKLGLWSKVQRKVVVPSPGTMVLAELIAKKADAAVVFKDCLFETGKPPKTIRIVGDLPLKLYSPIPYQIAPMRSAAGSDAARRFIDFLSGEEGREALRKAGLKPT